MYSHIILLTNTYKSLSTTLRYGRKQSTLSDTSVGGENTGSGAEGGIRAFNTKRLNMSSAGHGGCF